MSKISCECNCNSSFSCTAIGIIAAIIIGIITAFLTFNAVITVTSAFLWVVFGIAVVFLAINFVTSANARSPSTQRCLCSGIRVLPAGIFGTILLSLILLAVEFAATSVIRAIFTGLLLAFFTLIIVSAACISVCAAGCNE